MKEPSHLLGGLYMRVAALTIVAIFLVAAMPQPSGAVPSEEHTGHATGLRDGSRISANGGVATVRDSNGTTKQFLVPAQDSPGARDGGLRGASDLVLQRAFWQRRMGAYKPAEVVVAFRSGYAVTMVAAALGQHRPVTSAIAGDSQLSSVLTQSRAKSLTPLFGNMPYGRLSATSSAAKAKLGSRAFDITQVYRLKIGAQSPSVVAAALRKSPLVRYAEPNFYVSSMLGQQSPYPGNAQARAIAQAHKMAFARNRMSSTQQTIAPLPSNYALQSSLSSFLNANALNWTAAYELLEQRYSQLPGQGEIITNVSVGDLTDQSMQDNEVAYNGPTTTVVGGQRYLDAPSLPLIPTFVADENSVLDPLGSVEGSGDAADGEIFLDFSVMAPLPDSMQRAGRQGQGLLDLQGIAPGAQYRLVVPQKATFSNITAALMAASQQQPAPNVITASLGFGTDGQGFPGRYLEDDPMLQSIIASIVQQGIVVCISANDGTRVYTNEAVGPDGGSTPTELAGPNSAVTTISDLQYSTVPSVDADSGAIDVGGTTLDDIFSVDPSAGVNFSGETAFAETRTNGALSFSSGFGSRVNLSAPSDGIPSMVHSSCSQCSFYDVQPVLEGGTSASAPEVAAASAVVLQAARLAGKTLAPTDVRTILETTGRTIPTPPQIDTQLNVGPQIDLGAAVQSILGGTASGAPLIARIGVAERQAFDQTGAFFEENVDPAYIDLTGPYDTNGNLLQTNTISPITIAPDWVNMPAGAAYSLFVTDHPTQVLATSRWARLMPSQILTAAGLTLASPLTRTVSLTYRASEGRHLIRQGTVELTFSPSDGLTKIAPAPIAPPVVQSGQPISVSYDLSHTASVASPQLIVSNLDHSTFGAAPYFRTLYSQRLLSLKGTTTIPAMAFSDGGGLYGIEVQAAPNVWSYTTSVRVKGLSDTRPWAPTLSAGPADPAGHFLVVNRTAPQFTVHYDVTSVPNANGAVLEISAPGPNVLFSINNFNNPFGTARDNNGFDTPSSAFLTLSGTSGTAQLDALKLGLGSSLYYNVRVLPINGSTVIGQTSPVSTLEFSDNTAPGGDYLTAFDVSTDGTSTVSAINPDSGISSVYSYSPSSETYGNAIYADTSGTGILSVFGSDPSLRQSAVADYSFLSSNVSLKTIDQSSGAVVGTATVPTGAMISDQQVDIQRHRFAFLAKDQASGMVSITPFDMTTSTTGTSIPVGDSSWSPGGRPVRLALDRSSGKVYAMSSSLLEWCPTSSVAAIDLTAGTVSSAAPLGSCDRNLVSDGAGGSLYALEGPAFSSYYRNSPMMNGLDKIDSQSLNFVAQPNIGAGAVTAAVDSLNGLLLVGFLGSPNGPHDNSSSGMLRAFDLNTGRLVETLRTFNFAWVVVGYGDARRGIQLDPTTRTGWTFSGDGTAIQQFSY